MSSDVVPPSPAVDPSRGVADQDVACPMCDYNLRGLIEPRCPECGYTFLWIDLLDSRRRLHPYLFEHYPQRNVWSFFKTLLGNLTPGRFWATLLPSQPSRVGRLRAYWVVTSVLALSGLLAMFARSTIHRYLFGDDPWSAWLVGRGMHAVFWTTACLLAWPWLTYLTLQVFQASMERAKIKPGHVARCVVYGQDVVVFYGVIIAAVALGTDPTGPYYELVPEVALVACMACVAVFAWRMVQAYRKYTRFHRPVATIVASQVIVALVVVNVLAAWAFRNVRG